MERQIIIIAVTTIVAASLLGCSSYQRMECKSQNSANIKKEKQVLIGMPNPSAVYCVKLGYKYKIVKDAEGNESGVCIFPDGAECGAWDFYRGKSNQEWSYCKLHGYDLKDLKPYEGAVTGAVCIDKASRKEIGTVFDLFVKTYLSQSSPEDTRR